MKGHINATLAALFGLIGGIGGSMLAADAGRNGSGTYSLPSGNPVVAGTQITDTWANTTLQDIATALTASIAKDGQTTPTANLPMGGYRHTGVGTASARNHYGVVSQIQDGTYTLVGSVAGTDTITGSLTPSPSAYTDGMTVVLVPAATNTGAATVNLNGIAARSVVKNSGTALAAGDLLSGVPAVLVYDLANTRWSLINPQTLFDAELSAIGALAVTDSNIIVGNGSTWVAESGATARTSLGLGSIATQDSSSVSLTGGSITGITDLAVADGGTGASTLTGLLLGNGTSAFTAVANSSTVGQTLRVTGASTYAWGALDLADGDAITGDLPDANLSANVPLLNAANVFSANQEIRNNSPQLEIDEVDGDNASFLLFTENNVLRGYVGSVNAPNALCGPSAAQGDMCIRAESGAIRVSNDGGATNTSIRDTALFTSGTLGISRGGTGQTDGTARNITGKAGVAKTLSTSGPSGGSDGDIWYVYVP